MGKIWTLTEGTDALVQSSVHTAQWSRPPAVSTVERDILAVVEPLPRGVQRVVGRNEGGCRRRIERRSDSVSEGARLTCREPRAVAVRPRRTGQSVV